MFRLRLFPDLGLLVCSPYLVVYTLIEWFISLGRLIVRTRLIVFNKWFIVFNEWFMVIIEWFKVRSPQYHNVYVPVFPLTVFLT